MTSLERVSSQAAHKDKYCGVKKRQILILVAGLTNRPELLDPALLRPGRLEVQLSVELPDRVGRRDILRIHKQIKSKIP